jgi:drug/metabolite transporter (DMT)-like permease
MQISNSFVNADQVNHRARAPVSTLKLILQPRIVMALGAIYLLWSTSYLAIKLAGTEFPPLLLVGLRNLAAGVFMVCLVRLQNRTWGASRLWVNAAMVGILMISVGATLLATGIQYVTSGFASVAFAAVPLMVCVVMVARGQRIRRTQWLGTGVGIAGLLLMSYETRGLQESKGVWLILGAVVATASSAVMMDYLPMPKDLFVTTAVQMVAGGGLASLLGWGMGEELTILSSQAIGAWLYLTFLVSVLGYLSYTYLMTKAGPVMASSYAYVNPPIALLAGAWMLGEQVSGQTLIATGMVLMGAMTVLYATPSRALGASSETPAEKARPNDGS